MVSEQTVVQQILVIQTSKDIDIYTIHFFVQALKQKFTSASFTLMDHSPTPNSEKSWVDETLPWIITDYPPTVEMVNHCIETIQSRAFDAAFILNRPLESPYFWGYICYLAKIPIRVGVTKEFGGSVLSHTLKADNFEPASAINHYASLLNSVEKFDFGVSV